MVLDSAKKWWSGDEQKADGDGSGWNITEKLSSAASKVRDCSESAATSIGNSAKSAWNSEAVNTGSQTAPSQKLRKKNAESAPHRTEEKQAEHLKGIILKIFLCIISRFLRNKS